MALITMNYNSPTIGMHQNLTIILPEDVTFFDSSTTAKHLKSMLLLHGLSSDETTYIRYTSIERYANEHQLAIIMPSLTSIIVAMQIWYMDIVTMITY